MGNLGALLRAMRHEAGLTQEELADKAQLSARSLRAIESGGVKRPRVRTLRSIAVALGLTDVEFRHLWAGVRPQSTARPDNEPSAVLRSSALPGGGHRPEIDQLISRIADDPRLVVLSTANGHAVTALVIQLDDIADRQSGA